MKKELAKKSADRMNSAEMYVSPRACYCFHCPCSCSSSKVAVNNSGYTRESARLHSVETVS